MIFKDGIGVPSSGARITWDGDGILNGVIVGGDGACRIRLDSDLCLGGTASMAFSSTGSMRFYALNKKIVFNSHIDCSGSLGRIVVVGDSYMVIDGQKNTLKINQLVSNDETQSTLSLNNMRLLCLANAPIPNINNLNQLILNNVIVIGSRDSGTRRMFETISNPIKIQGTVKFLKDGDGRVKCGGVGFSIEKNSTLYIGPGVVLTNIGSITFEDQTAILHLDGCDFYTGNDVDGSGYDVTGTALSSTLSALTKGTLLFQNKVRIFNKSYGGLSNSDMSKALVFGDGTTTGGLNVRVLGGAYVIIDGCLQYKDS
ncbi:hypothetical protein FJ364_01315 [Candidatus Dependentiae bacterium]|nr:hypothetical protein [Candidatus Dependentiae bacterium]